MPYMEFARSRRLLEIYQKAMEEDEWATALRASELLMKTKAPTDLAGFLVFLFQQVLKNMSMEEVKSVHQSLFDLLEEKKEGDLRAYP